MDDDDNKNDDDDYYKNDHDNNNDQNDKWKIPFKSDDYNEESLASENNCRERVEQSWEKIGIPEICHF